LLLHAVLLVAAGLSLSVRRPAAPLEELPVEIWTADQLRALGGSASQEEAKQQEEREAPRGPTQGTIRATTILSGETLAHPLSRKMREMLPLFEEETRLEQLCGIEAMAQIVSAFKQFQPERIVAYARLDVRIEGNVLVAEGAAFRSGQEWHGLTFRCEFGADRKAITGFEFSIGKRIPKRLWEQYSLPWPALDTD